MQPLAEAATESPADTGVSDALPLAAAGASCGIGSWALDANNQLRADDAFLAIWGRTRDEFLHADSDWPLRFVHAEDRALAEAVFSVRAEAPRASEVLLRVIRPDGKWRWILCRRRSLDHSSRNLTAGVVVDVSSVRRHDDGRVHETISTFAARLAHDFNNLLFAILGNATLALGTMQLAQDHPIRESLREIERAATRASEIVQRISAFARPVQPRLQLLKLGPLVDAALRTMYDSAPPNIRVRTHLPAAGEPATQLDAKLVKELILGLLSNAFHASEGRSEVVSVGLEEIELRDQPWCAELGLRDGRYLELRVRDQGTGMDPATLDRAPEPFFSTRHRAGGMGLGLSIAQSIVKGHGGALRIESQLDQGTTVYAYFPVP